MQINIRLVNYRCFPSSSPASFALSAGFTALVGPNNSGKSALLRFFHEFRQLIPQLITPEPNAFLMSMLRGQTVGAAPQVPYDAQTVFANTNTDSLRIEFTFVPDRGVSTPPPATIPAVDHAVLIADRQQQWQVELFAGGERLEAPDGAITDRYLLRGEQRLASLQPLAALAELFPRTMYIPAFRNAVNVGQMESYYDIQIGQAFIQRWRTFQTGPVTSQNEAAYALTQEIAHVFGFRDLRIEAADDNQTLQIFINGKAYKLQQVGAGLTHFILTLMQAAIRQPAYILIDEPETNLHPSLQVQFLRTIGERASEGVLFTTHSIGLARAAANHIYSLTRLDEGRTQVRPLTGTPRLSEFLGEMSFEGYREIGFQKLLLAEGVTDAVALQELLRIYEKDRDVVVIPMGGDQLINGTQSVKVQLEEVKRICNSVSVLIDSEKKSQHDDLPRNRRAFKLVCDTAGITCHILERRALENYFTTGAVQAAYSAKYQALGPFEAIDESSPSWGKPNNWKVAQRMERDELDRTDLGEFLHRL